MRRFTDQGVDSFDTRTLTERNRPGIARLTVEKADMTTEVFRM
jgi:hypothetical protein